jgi:hypothetical protein
MPSGYLLSIQISLKNSHRPLLVDISNAKARSVYHLILKNDGDRETRYRTFCYRLFTEFLDFLHRLFHLLGCYLCSFCFRVYRQVAEQEEKCEEAYECTQPV